MQLPVAHLSVADISACAALILTGFAAGIGFAYRYLVPRKAAQTEKIKR